MREHMAKNGSQQKIDLLFQREAWNEARTLLKQEQATRGALSQNTPQLQALQEDGEESL